MNPETNRFEELTPEMQESLRNQSKEMERRVRQMQKRLMSGEPGTLLRPNGEPVPEHWSVFAVDDDVVIKNYTFRIKYIGETSMLLEPVGPVVVGEDSE